MVGGLSVALYTNTKLCIFCILSTIKIVFNLWY